MPALRRAAEPPSTAIFYDNSCCSFGSSVIVNGLPAASYTASTQAARKASFINFIKAKIASGTTRDRTGAQFIVQLMRGSPYDHTRPSAADITDWQNRINAGGVALIHDSNYMYSWDSAGDTTNNDDYFFQYGSSRPDNTLTFVAGGRVIFAIRVPCANPVGDLPGLPLAVTNSPPTGTITSVTCDPATGDETVKFSFADADAAALGATMFAYIRVSGQVPRHYAPGGKSPATIVIPSTELDPFVSRPIYLYVLDRNPVGLDLYHLPDTAASVVPCAALACGGFTITPPLIDPSTLFTITVGVTNNAGSPPPGSVMNLSIMGPGYTYNGSVPAVGGGATSTGTFANIGPTNNVGLFHVSWTMSAPASGLSQSCGYDFGDISKVFTVTALPYLAIFGGNAQVGSSPEAGSTCTPPNNDAGIYGWNHSGSPDYAGAGAQYAAQALGQIEGFASGLGGNNPAALSFSNTINTSGTIGEVDTTGNDLFGGGFGASTNDCDFSDDTVFSASLPAGPIVGTQVVHLSGDVYIGSDIVYSGAAWANLIDIPYFKLVVTGGNIYIGPNVSRLDGLYVAEPDAGGVGGTIYTCAHGNGNEYKPSEATYYNDCSVNRLVINGSFVAKSVQFLRTYGTLGKAKPGDTAATSNAAETFNYTPEMWLPRGSGNPTAGFDSITGLPPVL